MEPARKKNLLTIAILAIVIFVLGVCAARAEEPARSPWFVQVNAMKGEAVKFGLPFGFGYTFKTKGISLGAMYGGLRVDSRKGAAAGSVDFDDYFRWPPVPVTVPYAEPSYTNDTISLTFTWHPPMGR